MTLIVCLYDMFPARPCQEILKHLAVNMEIGIVRLLRCLVSFLISRASASGFFCVQVVFTTRLSLDRRSKRNIE